MSLITDYTKTKDFLRDLVDAIWNLTPYAQRIMPQSNPDVGVIVSNLATKGDLRETGDGIVQRWWPSQEIYARKLLAIEASNKAIFCFKNDRATRYIEFSEGWICEENLTDEMFDQLLRQCGLSVGRNGEENPQYSNKSRFVWIYRPDRGLTTRNYRSPGDLDISCDGQAKEAEVSEVRATLSPDPLDGMGALVDCGDSTELTND